MRPDASMDQIFYAMADGACKSYIAVTLTALALICRFFFTVDNGYTGLELFSLSDGWALLWILFLAGVFSLLRQLKDVQIALKVVWSGNKVGN